MRNMKFRTRKKSMLSGLIFALSFLFIFPASAGEKPEKGIMAEKIEQKEEQQNSNGGNTLIPGPVSMEVRYGYDNTAKGGRYVPVTVSLENKTGDDFKGNITISTMEADYEVYSYEYQVELQADESADKSYMIPFGKGSDQVFVYLTDEAGNQIAKKRLKMDINREVPELFIGILSDTPELLQYLDGVGISYSALKTRTIPLTKDEFPEETIGLSLMDVILVSNYRLRDLSEKQTKALMDWVKDGGILILGTGGRVDDTLGRFAPELLDDNYDTPQMMDIHLGEESDGQSALVQGILCTEIPLHGAYILDSEAGFPLVQAAAMEKGIVAVAAYDFADISSQAGQEPLYVDNMFTRLLGEERINSLDDYFYGSSGDEFWDVQSVINSGNVNRLPKVSMYFAVILLYILLVGPGIWLLLKKYEVQSYYWGAVAMLSMIFIAVIYLMGMGTRFKSIFLTYATIQDVSEESVIETSYVNVRNPYNKPYSAELAADYAVRPVSRNTLYSYSSGIKFTDSSKPKVTVSHKPDATKLEFHETVAFQSNYLEMKKTTDNLSHGGITGEIRYFDGKVTGSITNRYDFVLEDSAVFMYGMLVPLGDLQPGETRDLSSMISIHVPVGKEQFVAAKVTGLDIYKHTDISDKQYVQAMERSNLLAFYMRSELEGYRREARVTGFSRKQGKQFMGEKELDSHGLTLFTSAVPVYNETPEGEIYRSALMKAPKAQKGSYDYISNSMYGGDSVILEYSLGNDIEAEEITFCQIPAEMQKNQLLGPMYIFSGDMYFYNYNTGIYDKMEKDKMVFSVSQLRPYLSPGNTLTIKYIDSSQEESGWDKILPMPMVKGREK